MKEEKLKMTKKLKTKSFKVVKYTDPASVHKMFEIFQDSMGLLNTDTGLYINNRYRTSVVKKGDYVLLGQDDQKHHLTKELFRELFE